MAGSGQPDPSFTLDIDGRVTALSLRYGLLHAAGHFSLIDGFSIPRLLRFDERGDLLDSAFAPAPERTPLGLRIEPEGLYITGDFLRVGDSVRVGLARLPLPLLLPAAFNLLTPLNGQSIVLPGPVTEFRWQASELAATYRFILSRDGRVVLQRDGLTGTALGLSATELLALGSGDYTWTVRAIGNSGSTLANNGPFELSLRSGPLFADGFE